MKNIGLLLILLFVTTSLVSQDYKFGKVSKAEIEEKFYPLDSTADAAILYKYRSTYFDYNKNKGFRLVTEVKERVKIYNKNGFNRATAKISYYKPDSGEDEKVSSIKGYTYTLENGKIKRQKLSKSSIFDEKLSKYRSAKKITFPNIKEGCILDLEYRLESPYSRFVEDVNYQYDIPIKHFYTIIKTPEYYTYKKKEKGYYHIPVDKKIESGTISFSERVRSNTRRSNGGISTSSEMVTSNIELKYNIDIYKASNIPALNDNEPYVTDIKNYRGGVKYELESTKYPNSPLRYFSTTWEDVSKQIYKSSGFGGELSKTNHFKNDLSQLLTNTSNDFEKTVSILQFVKQKIKWNGYYGKYTEKGVKEAYKEGSGNVAEINLTLTAMLKEAGLNAYPVLASTRRNGIPLFPTLNGFNYVVSIVQFPDNKYVLLDATEPYSSPNVLPQRVLNWNGRIVTSTGKSTWIRLSPFKHSEEDNFVMVKMTKDLSLTGMSRTKLLNLSALNFRIKNNKVKEEYLISRFEESNAVEVDNFKVVNSYKLGQPIVQNVKFTSEDLVEEINNKIYIEPLLFLTQHQNPFKLKERKYPVDFASPLKFKNNVTIQIPEGYKVESLPKTMAIGLPDKLGFFKYQIINAGNKIKTVSVLQINSPIISPQYYKSLKDFYDQLVKKETEKIVLVKI